MDPDELIRALVSVGLVVTMSLGANCQGAAGGELSPAAAELQVKVSSAEKQGP